MPIGAGADQRGRAAAAGRRHARHLHARRAGHSSCRLASTCCARSCRPAGQSVKTVTRAFEIAPPKVLMTSADGLGATSVDAELFLPVDDATLSPVFRREDAIKPATCSTSSPSGSIRRRKRAFDEGVALSGGGRLREGRSELQARHSAGGRQHGAARVSRRGVCRVRPRRRGGERVADRARRRIGRAADLRLAERRAAARARARRSARRFSRRRSANGRPTHASPSRSRWSTARSGAAARRSARWNAISRSSPTIATRYYLAVQWLYTVHSAGAVVHTPAEDLKLAHDLRRRLREGRAVRSSRW